MIDVALVILLAAVLAFHGWTVTRKDRVHARDRARLVDALVARNAAEYAGLRAVDEPPKPRPVRRLEEHDFQVGS